MEIVTRRDWAQHLIARAAINNVCLFAPCVESAAEIEGVLMGAEAFAVEHAIDQLPLMLGFAPSCPANPQLMRVSPSGISQPDGTVDQGDAVVGYQILTGAVKTYASVRGLFHRVLVMLYVDRALPHADREITENTHWLRDLSLIVCDYTQEPASQIAQHLKAYQDSYGDLVLVEGLTADPLSPTVAKCLAYDGHCDFVCGPAAAGSLPAITDAVGKRIFMREDALQGMALEQLPEAGVIGLHVSHIPPAPTPDQALPANPTPGMEHDLKRRQFAQATKGYLRALAYARLGQPFPAPNAE